MGIETALILGFAAFSAHQQVSAAEKQSKLVNEKAAASAKADVARGEATTKQGSLEAKNKAQQVQLKAASQKSSFLNSGITLEGTPMSAISGTFDTGIKDVSQILENTRITAANYTTNAKNTVKFGAMEGANIMAEGRSAAIGTLVNAGMGMAGGSSFSNIGGKAQSGMAQSGLANTSFGRTFGGFSGDTTSLAGGETIFWRG